MTEAARRIDPPWTVLSLILWSAGYLAEKGVLTLDGPDQALPALIGNMDASKKVPPIAEDEYDNIYIVSIPWFGKTKTIRLRYGAPYQP